MQVPRNFKRLTHGKYSEMCCSCRFSREGIKHMLFNYSVLQTFWNDFKWYCYYNTEEVIMLYLKDIIVGVGGDGNDSEFIMKPRIQSFKIILNCILHRRIRFSILFTRSGSSILWHIDI